MDIRLMEIKYNYRYRLLISNLLNLALKKFSYQIPIL